MLKNISTLLEVNAADPVDALRKRILNFVLLGVSGVIAITIIFLLLTPPVPGTPILLASSVVFILVNGAIYIINRRYSGLLGASLFLAAFTALIFFADTPEELIQGRSLFFFALPISAASILLRPYMSFVVVLACSVILSLMAINQGLLINLSGMSGFIILALFSWLSASRMEIALKNVQKINSELDQRVQERTHELENANERLKGLDILKSKFVSDVSHELRTPVSNLTIYLDMLQSGGNIEKNNRYVSILRDETERLTKLVSDVLDLSRLELGRAVPKMDPINLNGILEMVIAAHSLRADVKDLELSSRLAGNLPLILGDADQISRVVNNLIGNAINYTREGFIRASSMYDAEHGEVRLMIEDSGLGIASADLEHVFERFYRGKNASQSTIPGTGLGLAITRELVELHNGRIEVESMEGQGSTFTVVFPAYRPEL